MYGEGAELIPGLAERWEVLEQGHVYRFHLRRGVRFHNGRTLEAKDVHDALVRLLLPETEFAVELDHARRARRRGCDRRDARARWPAFRCAISTRSTSSSTSRWRFSCRC